MTLYLWRQYEDCECYSVRFGFVPDGYGMYAVFVTDNYHVPLGEKGDLLSPMLRYLPRRMYLLSLDDKL